MTFLLNDRRGETIIESAGRLNVNHPLPPFSAGFLGTLLFWNTLNYKSERFYRCYGFSLCERTREAALAEAWLKRVINYELASTWMNAVPSIPPRRSNEDVRPLLFSRKFRIHGHWNMHIGITCHRRISAKFSPFQLSVFNYPYAASSICVRAWLISASFWAN